MSDLCEILFEKKQIYNLENLYSNNSGSKGKGKQNNQLKLWKFQQKGADIQEEKNLAIKMLMTNPSNNCKERSNHFKTVYEEKALK